MPGRFRLPGRKNGLNYSKVDYEQSHPAAFYIRFPPKVPALHPGRGVAGARSFQDQIRVNQTKSNQKIPATFLLTGKFAVFPIR
jgi:hypothetical protein